MEDLQMSKSESDAQAADRRRHGVDAISHHWDVQRYKALAAKLEICVKHIHRGLKRWAEEGNEMDAWDKYCISKAEHEKLQLEIKGKANVASRKRKQAMMAYYTKMKEEDLGIYISAYLPQFTINPILPDLVLDIVKWFDVRRDAFYSVRYADGLSEAERKWISNAFSQEGRRFFHDGPLLLPECFSFRAELDALHSIPEGALKKMSFGFSVDEAFAYNILGLQTDGRHRSEPEWTLDAVLLAQGVDAAKKAELLEQVTMPDDMAGIEFGGGNPDAIAEKSDRHAVDNHMDLDDDSSSGWNSGADADMMDVGDAMNNNYLPTTETYALADSENVNRSSVFDAKTAEENLKKKNATRGPTESKYARKPRTTAAVEIDQQDKVMADRNVEGDNNGSENEDLDTDEDPIIIRRPRRNARQSPHGASAAVSPSTNPARPTKTGKRQFRVTQPANILTTVTKQMKKDAESYINKLKENAQTPLNLFNRAAGATVTVQTRGPRGAKDPYHFRFNRGNPPPGVVNDHWDKAFNSADSVISHHFKSGAGKITDEKLRKDAIKKARENGNVRDLAICLLVVKDQMTLPFVDTNP
ncbi:hypothetical protein ACEPPN_009137 [Leptodophora sp. 'Broadleaf-Isolate-01']